MVVLRPLHELRTAPWDSSVLDSCDSWTHRCDTLLCWSSTNSRPFILPLPCNRPSQACVCFAIRTTRLLSSDRFGQPITILEKKTLLAPKRDLRLVHLTECPRCLLLSAILAKRGLLCRNGYMRSIRTPPFNHMQAAKNRSPICHSCAWNGFQSWPCLFILITCSLDTHPSFDT